MRSARPRPLVLKVLTVFTLATAAAAACVVLTGCGPDTAAATSPSAISPESSSVSAPPVSGATAAAPSPVMSAALGSTGTGEVGAATGDDPKTVTVQASVSHCGDGWTGGPAGRFAFTVHNTDTRNGEIALADARTGAVFTELEPLGPGTSLAFTVELTGGSYRFECAMEDEDVLDGPAVTVTGTLAGSATPSVLPVTEQDLIPATQAYEKYVISKLPGLVTAARKVQGDVAAGNRAAAEKDWLPAHLAYERLGAAYGAFGDADGVINGLPNGLPQGVQDPDFTGFHRLEYGLWHNQPMTGLRPFAGRLVTDLRGLQHTFSTSQIDPLEVSIRAHEITENALQFSLTGQDDFGSSSGLATVAANLDGTATVLGFLDTLLTPRDPQLGALQSRLARTRTEVGTFDVAGSWKGLDQLTPAQRETVNADLSQLTEMLAPVAVILEPRRF